MCQSGLQDLLTLAGLRASSTCLQMLLDFEVSDQVQFTVQVRVNQVFHLVAVQVKVPHSCDRRGFVAAARDARARRDITVPMGTPASSAISL